MNRRRFVQGLAVAASASTIRLRTAAAALTAPPDAVLSLADRLAHDPLRPQYHLLPTANWMNDPNGPIYWRGQYHMFYQYNPEGAFWGDMHWGHATSPDMIHWRQLPVALAPTASGPDSAGVFTGTAAVVDGRVQMLYTGVRSVPESEATIKNGNQSLLETQCVAISEADNLDRWTKLAKPVIATPPAGMQVNGFRDPSPWHDGDFWYLVLGSGTETRGGAVLLYRSKDLRRWEFLHVLAEREGSIAVPLSKPDSREVWECPDFFPLGEGVAQRHVLIYSTNGRSYWISGRLSPRTMRFEPEHSGVLDYGSYYAPKTQLDAEGRRILWGWIPETRSLEAYKAAGWAGLMSLPRLLTLGEDGRLRQQVAGAVEQLRREEKVLRPGTPVVQQLATMPLENYCGELRFKARSTTWAMECVEDSGQTWLRLEFSASKPQSLMVNSMEIPMMMDSGDSLECRIWVDGSSMEILINGLTAYTLRYYPAGTKARTLRLRWEGAEGDLQQLSLWQMEPISPDRLTR